MHGFAFNLLIKPVGIAIAVLVVAALSPSRAAAECGDYVLVLKNGSGESGTQTQHSPLKPCDGPNCSSKPGTPTAPLTVPVNDTESSKQFASGSGSDSDSTDSKKLFARQLLLNLPAPLPSSIFHPPRAA